MVKHEFNNFIFPHTFPPKVCYHECIYQAVQKHNLTNGHRRHNKHITGQTHNNTQNTEHQITNNNIGSRGDIILWASSKRIKAYKTNNKSTVPRFSFLTTLIYEEIHMNNQYFLKAINLQTVILDFTPWLWTPSAGFLPFFSF